MGGSAELKPLLEQGVDFLMDPNCLRIINNLVICNLAFRLLRDPSLAFRIEHSERPPPYWAFRLRYSERYLPLSGPSDLGILRGLPPSDLGILKDLL